MSNGISKDGLVLECYLNRLELDNFWGTMYINEAGSDNILKTLGSMKSMNKFWGKCFPSFR